MKTIIFNNCKSYKDIESAILNALQYDEVVSDEAAARQWFKDAGIEGDMSSDTVVSTSVSVWNEEMNGEEEYNVRVYCHYMDAGSNDYVYSYSID